MQEIDATWQYGENHVPRFKQHGVVVKQEGVPVHESPKCAWKDKIKVIENDFQHVYVSEYNQSTHRIR